MQYAALIKVDNSREDAEAGREGLRTELAPALKAMPSFTRTDALDVSGAA